jgi:signal transduction histidine kinase
MITVKNQGVGIPAEELPYVFERFYRIRSDQGRRAEGTGLGLPIAKWIAERHGGTIALTSIPGELTVLTISLPLLELART